MSLHARRYFGLTYQYYCVCCIMEKGASSDPILPAMNYNGSINNCDLQLCVSVGDGHETVPSDFGGLPP